MLKIFEWCHSQDLLEPHILVTMKDWTKVNWICDLQQILTFK